MNFVVEIVYVLSSFILLSAFYILGQPFIKSMIRAVIVQSVLLGLAAFALAYYLGSMDFLALGLLVIVLRGFVVSYVLERQLPRRKSLVREASSALPSTLLAAVAVSTVGTFAVYFYAIAPFIEGVTIGSSAILAFPFVMLFLAAFQIISRRNTYAQLIGYIEGENSMVLMGAFLLPIPFVIEATVFLDVIALVVISAIVVKEKMEHSAMVELRG